MHRYWAAAYPGDYKTFNIEKEWVETYKNEIYFTMNMFSSFFEQVVRFINQNQEYKLIVASSMGQASTEAEQLDSQVYVEKPEMFLSAMGLSAQDWTSLPSMFPQFNIKVNADKAETLQNSLRKMKIGGESIEFRPGENGFFAIDFGQKNQKDGMLFFDGNEIKFTHIGLHNLVIEDKAGATAYHIPEGTLLIYDPQHPAKANGAVTKVSSTAIAPNILANFNISIPDYMKFEKMEGLSVN